MAAQLSMTNTDHDIDSHFLSCKLKSLPETCAHQALFTSQLQEKAASSVTNQQKKPQQTQQKWRHGISR